jgi:hypothetical protein
LEAGDGIIASLLLRQEIGSLDSTRTDQSVMLRSPFNGETITLSMESCSPAMLEAMIQAGFVHLNAPKHKTRSKEISHGTSEADGH